MTTHSEPTYRVREDLTPEEIRMRFHELRGYIGTAYAERHDLNWDCHRKRILEILGITIED